ncbi:endonuclease/exonuclease/phosphatase family protein [Mariniluteicoccus flavus]
MSIRIEALNVASPSTAAAERLLAHLASADADVLVLSELGRGAGSSLLLRTLRTAGFTVLASDSAELGVAVVARALALEPLPALDLAVLPGRVLPVSVAGVRLLATYGAASDPVRYASAAQRERKRAFLAAWVDAVEGWLEPGSVVMGDLNLCDPVHTDRLPYVLPEETAAYVRLVGDLGLVDAWRAQNPDAAERSWVDHTGVGCRYDHALVTPDLAPRVTTCRLDHGVRPALTDHAALLLELGSEVEEGQGD